MKKFIARTAALLAAAVMTASAAVSCSDKDEHEDHDHDHQVVGKDEIPDDANISLDDLPYGGQFKKLLPEEYDTPIGVDFDSRYLTDEEAAKIADYFYSISEKKAEYLEKALHPDYLKFVLAQTGFDSAQTYVENEYELIKQFTESDYSFDFVLIDDMVDNSDGTAFTGYDVNLRKALPDANFTDRKAFMVNCTYTVPSEEGGSHSLQARLGDYIVLCVYTIDGEPYVVF